MTQQDGSAYTLAIVVVSSIVYLVCRGVAWYDLLVVLLFEVLITMAAFIGGYTTLAKTLGIPDSECPLPRNESRN